MIICLGPVCVPLHLLIPFLLAWAHQRGWLTWIKREWVTLAWWTAAARRCVCAGGAPPARARRTHNHLPPTHSQAHGPARP